MNHDLTPWLRSANDLAVDPWIDAQNALMRGQYALARRQLLKLASESGDDDVRGESRRLLRSIAPDPVALVVWSLLVCFILGLLISYVAL